MTARAERAVVAPLAALLVALGIGACGPITITTTSSPTVGSVATATASPTCTATAASLATSALVISSAPTATPQGELAIYEGTGLTPDYDFGVDTSDHTHTKWLTDLHSSVVLAYPSGQQWGTAFVTFGPSCATGAQRQSQDLSRYRVILVELRGHAGGERVQIGIKDTTGAASSTPMGVVDEGPLTTDWQSITVPLSAFHGVDLTHLFVVFEVDFQGTTGETVELRNLRYSS